METLAYETDHKYNMLEGLPLVFHTDPVKRNVYANWHENIEILACIEGEGTLFCDSESHDFTVGDILVINSNQVHRVGSENGVTYHCFIIDNDFCNKYGIDMTKLRFRTRITDKELYKTFIHIAELICGINDENKLYSKAEICSYILLALTMLCRDFTESSVNDYMANDKIKRAIDYINSNYSSDITLDELANFIGFSKFHLSREFKRIMGQTVFEYLISFRCKIAKRMIKGGSSVSESAVAVGFENLSYFSRQFKRFYGTLPSQYMKEVKRLTKNKG